MSGDSPLPTDALCQIVFPAIDLDRPDDGTQYGGRDGDAQNIVLVMGGRPVQILRPSLTGQ